jgi:sulfate permease, SulP family
VVIGAVFVATWIGLGDIGVKLLGEVPKGIPLPSLPSVTHADIRELLPLALACFLLGAVETAAIGKTFAEKHGYRFDANQELLAIAGANLAAGVGQGFPVSGGMSQSLVNEGGGAKTPISILIASGIMLGIALFFTGLLRNLPQPALAAIVLMSVVSLFKVKELVRLWRVHRSEFFVAATALAGVLWAGVLQGVLIGAVISLVLLIRRAANPHVAFLGKIPGANRYSDRERHPDNEPTPGILLFRVEASLVYFNAEHIYDTVFARLAAAPEPIRLVVWDLSTSPMVDMAGARLVKSIHAELEKRGIPLRLAEARSSVRDLLRTEGVEEKVGRIDRFTTLADAVGTSLPPEKV